MIRRYFFVAAGCVLCGAGWPRAHAAGAPSRGELADLFEQEARTTLLALSPNGRIVAYDVRGRRPYLVLLDPTRPEAKVTVRVAEEVLALQWISDEELVYGTENEIRAVQADGSDDRKLVNSDDLAIFIATGAIGGGPITEGPGGGDEQVDDDDSGEGEEVSAADSESDEGDDSTPVVGSAEKILRLPRLLPHQPLLPGTILVGVAQNYGEVFAIDVATAQRRSTGRNVGNRQYLADQTGRIRVSETNYLAGSPPYIVPQRFEQRTASEILWRNLDKLLGGAGDAHFEHGAADFYSIRSIPVGFGVDPNLLLVASNRDTDTYGIAGWSLATGAQSGIALHSPNFDLVSPAEPFVESTTG